MSEGDAPLSDADKIRLKRLARLAGPSTISDQPPPPPPDSVSSAEQSSSAPRAPSSTSRLLNPDLVSSTPSNKIARKPSLAESSRPSRRVTSSKVIDPSKKPTPTAAVKTVPVKPYTEWENETQFPPAGPAGPAGPADFAAPTQREAAEGSDWQLCWLKDLQLELGEGMKDETSPLVTSIDLADSLLVARLQMDPNVMAHSDDPDKIAILAGLPQDETVFEYLTGCWKRLYVAQRNINRYAYSPDDKARWHEAFDKLKALIISYCGMTLEDPSMFPQPARPTGPAEFLPILLALTPTAKETSSGDPSSGLTSAPPPTSSLGSSDIIPFLTDLASGTQDVLSDVLTPTLSLFFQEWFKIMPSPDLLGSEWRRYLGAMATLVQIKAIAGLLPSLDIWIAPGVDAFGVEWKSLLGPLTRLSVFPREFPEIWKAYFSNPTERKKDDIDANKSNLRHTLNALQVSLFNIYNAIVRSSPEAREGVLAFYGKILHLNHRRAGMRADPKTISSDGFMTNLHVVLLKLFEPVMDVSFSKLDKVDPDYFRATNRLNIDEETRIRATKEETDAYHGMDVERPAPSFVTDLFFLLNAFQHLGLVKTIGTRIRAEKNMSELEKDMKRTEAARGDWTGNPALEAQGEATLKKLKGDIATLHASIHAYDTQLLDPTLTRLNVNFMSFLMTWLVRLVDPKHQHPSIHISLPLPSEAPIKFRMLPEYLFDNVTEYYDFLARYEPEALDDPDKDILITFAITFLSPGYVNNPFLKAKLVSILANGLYPVGYYRKGTLYDRLGVHTLSTEHLMPTLIRFFIDVEMTGGHTQFWDKFNFRRDISKIFRSMWANPLQREAFVKSRHDDFDQFIKFVNMLMSDTTFHLEESLTHLAKINSIQTQRSNVAVWGALPQSEREDLESQLRAAESNAPYHTIMGLDHIELIRDFTATTREPFVTGEIVDRLVAALDGNLVNLVGPTMQDLRVPDPDRFHFKPKRLLAGIAQIYLNLGHEPDFIRAVANDGRSYSKDLFERFARILKNRAIMTDSEVAEVIAFTHKVEDMKATIEIEDEREIPDEYLDPLLSTLMKDPVILPMSRVVIDRSTIRTVLLSKELDPFNNMPLKFEDCIPDTELKAKIEAWVAEGKAKTAGDVMEVDEL